ncbi:876_t:CDS:2 [Entrophospora sp. SA101]|nr:876_t:CDS:2 [Entrophospora sp. SA101]
MPYFNFHVIYKKRWKDGNIYWQVNDVLEDVEFDENFLDRKKYLYEEVEIEKEDVSRKSYLSSLEYELERLKTLDKGKALEEKRWKDGNIYRQVNDVLEDVGLDENFLDGKMYLYEEVEIEKDMSPIFYSSIKQAQDMALEDVSRKSYLSSLEYELERLKTLDKGKALEGVKYANVPEFSINSSKF